MAEVERQGISQTALGSAVGISQSQLSKHLRAERTLTIDELDALCAALRLDIVKVVTVAHARAYPEGKRRNP